MNQSLEDQISETDKIQIQQVNRQMHQYQIEAGKFYEKLQQMNYLNLLDGHYQQLEPLNKCLYFTNKFRKDMVRMIERLSKIQKNVQGSRIINSLKEVKDLIFSSKFRILKLEQKTNQLKKIQNNHNHLIKIYLQVLELFDILKDQKLNSKYINKVKQEVLILGKNLKECQNQINQLKQHNQQKHKIKITRINDNIQQIKAKLSLSNILDKRQQLLKKLYQIEHIKQQHMHKYKKNQQFFQQQQSKIVKIKEILRQIKNIYSNHQKTGKKYFRMKSSTNLNKEKKITQIGEGNFKQKQIKKSAQHQTKKNNKIKTQYNINEVQISYCESIVSQFQLNEGQILNKNPFRKQERNTDINNSVKKLQRVKSRAQLNIIRQVPAVEVDKRANKNQKVGQRQNIIRRIDHEDRNKRRNYPTNQKIRQN